MMGADVYAIGILQNELPGMSKSKVEDPMLSIFRGGDANRLQA